MKKLIFKVLLKNNYWTKKTTKLIQFRNKRNRGKQNMTWQTRFKNLFEILPGIKQRKIEVVGKNLGRPSFNCIILFNSYKIVI